MNIKMYVNNLDNILDFWPTEFIVMSLSNILTPLG